MFQLLECIPAPRAASERFFVRIVFKKRLQKRLRTEKTSCENKNSKCWNKSRANIFHMTFTRFLHRCQSSNHSQEAPERRKENASQENCLKAETLNNLASASRARTDLRLFSVCPQFSKRRTSLRQFFSKTIRRCSRFKIALGLRVFF